MLAREKKPAIIFIDEIDAMCRQRGEGNEMASARNMMNEFLIQMQGVGKDNDGVLVLGATNLPWEIDAAMRRRFEKRIYIPLPDRNARARIFRLNLGGTPNNLTEADYMSLAERSEGMSGADISVVVREALMEPVRKSRVARYFYPVAGQPGKYSPTIADPPCSYCTPDLSSRPAPHRVACRSCGCIRADLLELRGDELIVPDIAMEDFDRVMPTSRATVGVKELDKYVDWTKQFGMDGV